MKVILPCCGRSSRYPNLPPKWMLPGHDGRPMLASAVAKIAVPEDDLIVVILAEHEEKYQVRKGIAASFRRPVRTIVLPHPTASQAETVARALEESKLAEPFLVKDSDNVFALDEVEQGYNYVCVDSLNNFDSINPRNKSYLQTDHKGVVTNIREKVVISDQFSVGGYYFTDPAVFLDYYAKLSRNKAEWQRELYLSDVIGAMILDGIPFRARTIKGYQDWGTIHEWRRALLSRRVFFAQLDGFVFERGSEFFEPLFANVQPNPEAIASLAKLAEQGHTIVYLSIRPPGLAGLTIEQLAKHQLPQGQVVYGCPVSSWVLLTAPHPTLPFQTSHALELDASDGNLLSKILGES
jgi:dTDP-glucose pyrophosphorylase